MATFTQGPPQPPSDPLALSEPKSLSPLFGSAWRLWIGQPGVFLVTAAWVVIPLYVVLVGLVGDGFHDSLGQAVWWADGTNTLLVSTIGSALITAVHSRAVVKLAARHELTTGEALRLGFQGFFLVLAAALLYALATVVGFLLLIIPGVFIAIAGMFAPQHAALTGSSALASLKASVSLVKANGWWRTLGYSFVLGLVNAGIMGATAIPVLILSFAFGEPDNFGMFVVPVLALMQAATMSWTALVNTLLYFSWRANAGDPYTGGADPQPEHSPLPQ